MEKEARSEEEVAEPPQGGGEVGWAGEVEREENVLVNEEEEEVVGKEGGEEGGGEGMLVGTDSENRAGGGGAAHGPDDDAWAYRVEMAIREERIMQLEKWKQDKMTTVQYIWAELGAKHVKLGQEQEQLEKLTKLIEKETQEVEALKSKYQHDNRDLPKDSNIGQVEVLPRQQMAPFIPMKRGRGRPRKSFPGTTLTPPPPSGKRKRGRPRKLDSAPRARTAPPKTNVEGTPTKRPRGRPRKYPRPVP